MASTGFSDALCQRVWNHLARKATWALPGSIYLGASVTDPLPDGSGISEPTDAAYARVNITASMGAAAARAATNSGIISFAKATAAWGEIGYYFTSPYASASAGSEYWTSHALAPAVTVGIGGTLKIPAGELDFSLPWDATLGGASDDVANALLAHLLGQGAWAMPAALHLALSLADPDQDGSGLSEPAGVARVDVSTAIFPTTYGRILANAAEVAWAALAGPVGPVTHLALMDAAAAGNLLLAAVLATAKSFVATNEPALPVGELAWELPWTWS